MREIRSLTGLRGVAALLVMLTHYNLSWLPFLNLFQLHNVAVDLFFCLSGFTLTIVYPMKTLPLRQYALARLGRIYPLYLATLIWAASVRVMGILHDGGFERSDEDFLAQILMINAWPLVGSGAHWDGPAWSISIEFFCYFLVFPFARQMRFRFWAIPGLVFCSTCGFVALRYVYDPNILEHGVRGSLEPSAFVAIARGLAGFLSGCVIGRDFLETGPLTRFMRGKADVLTLGMLLYLALCGYVWTPATAILFCFPWLIVAMAYERSYAASVLGHPLMHRIGVYSYSIYLLHMPVKITAAIIFPSLEWMEGWPSLALIGSVAALTPISYHFIEAPWRNAFRALGAVRQRDMPLRSVLGWPACLIASVLFGFCALFVGQFALALGPNRELVNRWVGARVFKEGWSFVEADRVWGIGARSVLAIPISETTPQRVALRGYAFVTPSHPQVTISVFLNGVETTKVIATLEQPAFAAEYVMPIGEGSAEVSFVTDSPASPKSLGLSDDDRALSVALQSLRIF